MLIVAVAAFAVDGAVPDLPDFDKLWNYRDPAATQAEFERLLEPAAASGNDDYYHCLQTQIARCQGLQGKFSDAHATLDRVEQYLKHPSAAVVRARYLLERGRVFNSSGEIESARPLFAEALSTAMQAELPLYAVDAAHMLAIVEATPEKQIEWNIQALQIADTNPVASRWKPSLWNNLGEAYRAAGEYEKSLACFQSIIQWQQDNGKPIDRYTRIDEARLLRLCGRANESMTKIRALSDELAGEIDGFVSEELAENLLLTNDEAAARQQFINAWQKLRDVQWLKDSEPQRYERLRKLGSD